VAEELERDALERDRANQEPRLEVELLRQSGLLTLLAPAEAGGGGGHWESAFDAIRIIARADASIAQLLAYHYVNQGGIGFYAAPEDQLGWWEKAVDGAWLWGDSVNPTDPDLLLTDDPAGRGWRLNGAKRFSTGSSVGEVIIVNALVSSGARTGEVLAFVLETDRDGLSLGGDWDNLGQRLTASGSVSYDNVLVTPADVLGPVTDVPVSTLLTPALQLAFGGFYLGVAEGALARGRELLLGRRNSWFLASVDRYAQDPLFQAKLGRFKARLAAVAALAESLFRRFDVVLSRDAEVTSEARWELAVRIAELKVVATETSLDVTQGIYDLTGSSSTANSVGLDRYWRNVRTHSLHDPVDYKAVEVGAYYLDGTTPPLSLYT
jgi:alkylation response protein AidB-like acyl-CoA dehydrogenase